MRLNGRQTKFLFLVLFLPCILVSYQNCGIGLLTGEKSLDLSSGVIQSVKSEVGGGNGEGYQGKTDVYVALDTRQDCEDSRPHHIAIKEKIEITGRYVVRTIGNCNALIPPEIIPPEKVYFARNSLNIVVDNMLFRLVKTGGVKEILSDQNHTYIFCTNMYMANPAEGVEVRVIHSLFVPNENYRIISWIFNLTVKPVAVQTIDFKFGYFDKSKLSLQSKPVADGSKVILSFPSFAALKGNEFAEMSYSSPRTQTSKSFQTLKCWSHF